MSEISTSLSSDLGEKKKVILRKLDGKIIKGYLEGIPDWVGAEFLKILSLSDEIILVKKSEIKALFFVRRFGGNKEHAEVRFFDTHPKIDGLWIRITFKDDEVLEGIVSNSFDFFVQDGFYIKPPDPNTNNRLVYILKSALKDMTILGIQYSRKNLAEFYEDFQNSKTATAKTAS